MSRTFVYHRSSMKEAIDKILKLYLIDQDIEDTGIYKDLVRDICNTIEQELIVEVED